MQWYENENGEKSISIFSDIGRNTGKTQKRIFKLFNFDSVEKKIENKK